MRYVIVLVILLCSTTAWAFDTTVMKGPVISGVTQTDAWVAWETTNSEGPSCLLYSGTPSLTLSPSSMDGDTFTDPGCSADHFVHLTGLSPATTYTFTLDEPWDSSAALSGPVSGTFITAPATTDGTFSFVIYGDTRDNPIIQSSLESDHQSVVNAIVSNDMDASFIVNTGDLALNITAVSGDDNGYTEFFDVERALLSSRAVFTAIGNHETFDTSEFDALVNAPSLAGAPHPYYWSTDWGQVHFTFLDSFEGPANILKGGAHDPAITDAQAAWVEQDLAAAHAAGQMIFIVAHQGPFSHSMDSKAHGGSPDFQSKIVPLMLKYGVLAVFAGHDHYYQRGHEGCIDYFVVGGGGAQQYMPDPMATGVEFTQEVLSYVVVNVNGHQATGEAKATDGSILDTFNFAVPDGTSCGVPPLGGSMGGPDAGSGSDDGGTISTADAGSNPSADAGAGNEGADAGTNPSSDAGTVTQSSDGGSSAGLEDAGTSSSGTPSPVAKTGCGCGGGETASAALLLGFLALVRRRRSHG